MISIVVLFAFMVFILSSLCPRSTYLNSALLLPENVTTYSNIVVVKRVVTKRRDITAPCFAASMKEVWTKCLLESEEKRAAFLCDGFHNNIRNKRGITDKNSTVDNCNVDRAVLLVRDAIVIDRRGVVLDTKEGTVYDVSGGCCLNGSELWKAGDRIAMNSLPENWSENNTETIRSLRPLLLLAHSHDETYYHFVIELLGRILQVRALFDLVQEGLVDIFVGGGQTFHKTYLDLLLCSDKISSGPGTALRDQACHYRDSWIANYEVLVSGKVFPVILLPPDKKFNVLRHLQQVLRRKTEMSCSHVAYQGNKDGQIVRFLVLVREHSRKVLNIDKLVNVLELSHPRARFVKVFESELAKMTMQEYATLFCNVHGIIGGHGAGLANMVWMKVPSTKIGSIIQIVREGQSGNAYQAMAKELDLHYKEISASFVDASKSEDQNSHVLANICEAIRSIDSIIKIHSNSITGGASLIHLPSCQ